MHTLFIKTSVVIEEWLIIMYRYDSMYVCKPKHYLPCKVVFLIISSVGRSMVIIYSIHIYRDLISCLSLQEDNIVNINTYDSIPLLSLINY